MNEKPWLNPMLSAECRLLIAVGEIGGLENELQELRASVERPVGRDNLQKIGGNAAMELEKLKTLAQDVTQWSNCDSAWLDQSEDEPAAVVGHINDDGETYPVATIDCDQYYAASDSLKLAKFYAAANPETVLRLIAMIEASNAEVSGGL